MTPYLQHLRQTNLLHIPCISMLLSCSSCWIRCNLPSMSCTSATTLADTTQHCPKSTNLHHIFHDGSTSVLPAVFSATSIFGKDPKKGVLATNRRPLPEFPHPFCFHRNGHLADPWPILCIDALKDCLLHLCRGKCSTNLRHDFFSRMNLSVFYQMWFDDRDAIYHVYLGIKVVS